MRSCLPGAALATPSNKATSTRAADLLRLHLDHDGMCACQVRRVLGLRSAASFGKLSMIAKMSLRF